MFDNHVRLRIIHRVGFFVVVIAYFYNCRCIFGALFFFSRSFVNCGDGLSVDWRQLDIFKI